MNGFPVVTAQADGYGSGGGGCSAAVNPPPVIGVPPGQSVVHVGLGAHCDSLFHGSS